MNKIQNVQDEAKFLQDFMDTMTLDQMTAACITLWYCYFRYRHNSSLSILPKNTGNMEESFTELWNTLHNEALIKKDNKQLDLVDYAKKRFYEDTDNSAYQEPSFIGGFTRFGLIVYMTEREYLSHNLPLPDLGSFHSCFSKKLNEDSKRPAQCSKLSLKLTYASN